MLSPKRKYFQTSFIMKTLYLASFIPACGGCTGIALYLMWCSGCVLPRDKAKAMLCNLQVCLLLRHSALSGTPLLELNTLSRRPRLFRLRLHWLQFAVDLSYSLLYSTFYNKSITNGKPTASPQQVVHQVRQLTTRQDCMSQSLT